MKILTVKSLVVLVVMGCLAYSAAAVDILYDFEDQSDPTNIPDVLTADGGQNGQANQPSGNGLGFGPTFGPTVGVGGSGGMDFANPTTPNFFISNMVETQGVVDYVTAMSYSVDINPAVAAAPGTYVPLLWTGENRGAGETQLLLNEFGQLEFHMSGLNPGITIKTTATNLIQLNQYQSVGFTLGLSTNEFTYYINGVPIETIPGIGLSQATLPNNGNAQGTSPTQFGWLQNIPGGVQTNYRGFLDNMFISNRLVGEAEMAGIQIPEPATLILLGLGAVSFLRRRK